MFNQNDILDDRKSKVLREKSLPVEFPMEEQDISLLNNMIYVEEGEGCLSVNRPVEGIVPRYARVTIEYFDEFGNKKQVRVREEIAVAFQHEIDHLDGILFPDRIDKKDPYKNKENMRSI